MLSKHSCLFILSSTLIASSLCADDDATQNTPITEQSLTPPASSDVAKQPDAQPISPELVQQQLDKAEKDFKTAKEMFNPWYTGPLITPSANLLPPGLFNMQPYLFVTDNYAHFDEHGKSHSIPDLISLKGLVVLQAGVFDWLNILFTPQYIRNSQSHHCASNFGDTSVSLNFGLYKETSYYPGVAFSIGESFPSGKYQKLNPKKGGVDATGAGSYETTFSLNFGKVLWWWLPKHPMNTRLSLSYQFAVPTHIEGFNAYGGGFHTHGKVHPGSTFSADFGYEFSINQRWVLALDAVYSYTRKTTFSGNPGVDAFGLPTAVGGPFNDQFSLAPAIEYNLSSNFGFIAGVWFSPWGRNSLDFVSGVFSFEWTFGGD
jgi:hypothetical protein